MNENTNYNIHQRIYNFVIRVIKLVNALPKTSSNIIVVPQLLRSATSMGANDQEADGASTKKDFLHCYTIVRKESKETNFWLMVVADTNPDVKIKMDNIIQEGREISAIVSSIIIKTRARKIK